MEVSTVTQTVRSTGVPADVRNALYRINSSHAQLLAAINTGSNIDFLKNKLKTDLEHLRSDMETIAIFCQTSPHLIQGIPELSAEVSKSGMSCRKVLDAVQNKKSLFREYLGSDTLKRICLDIRQLMPNVNISGGVNISLDGKVNISNNTVTERAATGINTMTINPMDTTHTMTSGAPPAAAAQQYAYVAPPGVMPVQNPYGSPQMMQQQPQQQQYHHYPNAPM